jgi:hypothetical protein
MLKDAFICHASEDKRLARSVWIRLSQYGVTAWLDEAEMSAGDILVQKIATAIHTSHWFIALLTPTSVTKKWVRFELNQAMDREIREGRTFIIPVVADDCEIPAYLRNKLYIDIRNRADYDKGIAALIKTIRHDTKLVPLDFLISDLSDATHEELLALPRSQFALENCLRSEKWIARTVRTLAATANLLPKQLITYCEEVPHIIAYPTVDASGDIYYGLTKRIMRRYRSKRRYGNEMTVFLKSLQLHSSSSYSQDIVSHFLSYYRIPG